jgi:uncharacterized protein (TIGR02246 family)
LLLKEHKPMLKSQLLASILVAMTVGAFGQSRPTSTDAVPDRTGDDAAIKRVAAQYVEYWNRHEFAKTAELRTEDSENVNVVGQRSTRADIVKGGPSYYQQAFGNSTIHDTVISIKYLKPDVAAVDLAWDMTGAKCPDGSDASYRVGLKSLVMTKIRGKWLIAIFHNMDLPTPADRGATRTLPCQFR